MRSLHFLFSPNGRVAPQSFAIAAATVYVLGAASHLLTMPDVLARGGLWPFVAAQAVLIWVWFALHARRLHDAGHTGGLAVGVSLLYILSVVLLLIVADGFFSTSDNAMANPSAMSALGLMLILYVVATLLGSAHYDFAWLMVAILLLMAFLPVLVALAFTLWTATRPRLENAPEQR